MTGDILPAVSGNGSGKQAKIVENHTHKNFNCLQHFNFNLLPAAQQFNFFLKFYIAEFCSGRECLQGELRAQCI